MVATPVTIGVDEAGMVKMTLGAIGRSESELLELPLPHADNNPATLAMTATRMLIIVFRDSFIIALGLEHLKNAVHGHDLKIISNERLSAIEQIRSKYMCALPYRLALP